MLTVVRHAESIENATKYSGFYQDPRPRSGGAAHAVSKYEVGLTPKGHRQSAWLRSEMNELLSADVRAFTSQYRRTKDTANLVLAGTGHKPQETHLLNEQYYADATYMTKAELLRAYPTSAHLRLTKKHLWIPPGGGESMEVMIAQRAVPFVEIARVAFENEVDVLAFTHLTTIMALRTVLELRTCEDVIEESRRRKFPNAGMLFFELTDGKFQNVGFQEPPNQI